MSVFGPTSSTVTFLAIFLHISLGFETDEKIDWNLYHRSDVLIAELKGLALRRPNKARYEAHMLGSSYLLEFSHYAMCSGKSTVVNLLKLNMLNRQCCPKTSWYIDIHMNQLSPRSARLYHHDFLLSAKCYKGVLDIASIGTCSEGSYMS